MTRQQLLSPVVAGVHCTEMSCPTRRFLVQTVLDAIEKSAIAKQQYASAGAENVDRLTLAVTITKGAERTALRVLEDHIKQHGCEA